MHRTGNILALVVALFLSTRAAAIGGSAAPESGPGHEPTVDEIRDPARELGLIGMNAADPFELEEAYQLALAENLHDEAKLSRIKLAHAILTVPEFRQAWEEVDSRRNANLWKAIDIGESQRALREAHGLDTEVGSRRAERLSFMVERAVDKEGLPTDFNATYRYGVPTLAMLKILQRELRKPAEENVLAGNPREALRAAVALNRMASADPEHEEALHLDSIKRLTDIVFEAAPRVSARDFTLAALIAGRRGDDKKEAMRWYERYRLKYGGTPARFFRTMSSPGTWVLSFKHSLEAFLNDDVPAEVRRAGWAEILRRLRRDVTKAESDSAMGLLRKNEIEVLAKIAAIDGKEPEPPKIKETYSLTDGCGTTIFAFGVMMTGGVSLLGGTFYVWDNYFREPPAPKRSPTSSPSRR